MIKDPQIFIIFEPGMYGTFLCSLFMFHPLWQYSIPKKIFNGKLRHINAHKSGYKDLLPNFHSHNDFMVLQQNNFEQLEGNFSVLNNKGLGVHRLSSYYFLQIEYEKYFSNFVRIIIKPRKDRLDTYARRMDLATKKDIEKQWWFKKFRKKKLANIPEWFIEKISAKEKKKYLDQHTKFLENNAKANNINDFYFDPDNIKNIKSLENIIKKSCEKLGISTFQLPNQTINDFVKKNKAFL